MNPAFDLIFQAELKRTRSTARAYGRAVVIQGFLLAIIQPTDDVRLSPSKDQRMSGSFYRHKATLRRAGIAPITSPSQLAALAHDLGATNWMSMGRLLWVLNTDRHTPTKQRRSWDLFIAANANFIDAARADVAKQTGASAPQVAVA